jgi:hypothetical protein
MLGHVVAAMTTCGKSRVVHRNLYITIALIQVKGNFCGYSTVLCRSARMKLVYEHVRRL